MFIRKFYPVYNSICKAIYNKKCYVVGNDILSKHINILQHIVKVK